jgi:hypothetical protein
MNVQERDQLLQFFSSLQRTAAQARDPVAEGLIRQRLSEGVSVYDLVQRAMALTLALQAAQAREAQWQALCAEQAAQLAQGGPAAAESGQPQTAARALQSVSSPPPVSAWGQGLLRQVGGTAVGVATGVIAGSLLIEAWQSLVGADASVAQVDPGEGLWGLGGDAS